jgi:toxin-antitoxin system PIN domain toxin
MKLLDVNILVYAHRKDAPDHARYRVWLEQALDGQEPIAVSELVCSGFLRIVTHPRVFVDPTPLDTALEFIWELRRHTNLHIAAPGNRHWPIFTTLCTGLHCRGNAIPDAYHAALALETDSEWISADTGFSRYPDLRWRHPLD